MMCLKKRFAVHREYHKAAVLSPWGESSEQPPRVPDKRYCKTLLRKYGVNSTHKLGVCLESCALQVGFSFRFFTLSCLTDQMLAVIR